MYQRHIFKKLIVDNYMVRTHVLCCTQNKLFKNVNITSYNVQHTNSRNLNVQATIENIVKTQTGIFKGISESIPVSYCQDFIVKVHAITGLPWWASIIFTTIVLRSSITLPLAIYQNYILAKVNNLSTEINHIVKELKKETTIAMKNYNWTEKYARAVYNRSVSLIL